MLRKNFTSKGKYIVQVVDKPLQKASAKDERQHYKINYYYNKQLKSYR